MSKKDELDCISDFVIECVEFIFGGILLFILVSSFIWVPALAGLFLIYTPTIILEILLGLIIFIVIASYIYKYKSTDL